MPLISMRQMLDHAAENNYGVPAFNVNNLEQMRAIMLLPIRLKAQSLFRLQPVLANMPVHHFCVI